MIDIIVQRGENPIDGGDITDPLLSSVSAAMARGTAEIDAASPVQPVTMEVAFRQGLKPGQLVEVLDGLQGQTWRGKIVSVDNAVEGTEITTNLRVMRVL